MKGGAIPRFGGTAAVAKPLSSSKCGLLGGNKKASEASSMRAENGRTEAGARIYGASGVWKPLEGFE